ncbi:MAG: hypothetical protein ACE5IR_09890 [bacterium]
MTKYIEWIRAVLLFPIIMIFMDAVAANAQSSPNFTMVFDVFSQAGKPSTSQNYQLRDCLGQPSAIGESNNGLVLLDPGFMGWRPPTARLAFNFTPGWSWISLYVKPDDLALEQVFAGMQHLVIAVNGAGQFYIPNVVNSIGNLDVLQGYKVYFDGAEQLEFTGSWVPSFTPIDLSAGWNFISYLAASDLDAETALQTILPDLNIVKDDAGHFFIPGVINTLGKMKLQKGYKVYMKKSATLVYPVGAGGNNRARTLAEVLNVRQIHEP